LDCIHFHDDLFMQQYASTANMVDPKFLRPSVVAEFDIFFFFKQKTAYEILA